MSIKKQNALEVQDLSVYYSFHKALNSITLKVPEYVRCAIVGPNGAGKTTFLKTILNLISPSQGVIKFWDKDFSHVYKKIAYVPQRKMVDWTFPITVHDAVLMGVESITNSLLGSITLAEQEKINNALGAMKLSAFAKQHINNLSGGQQQRVFIARALVQEADLYLLDEPLTGLDKISEKTIAETFKELQKNKKTIIAVHHDWHTLGLYFDWVIFLNRDLVYCGPYDHTLIESLLEKTF